MKPDKPEIPTFEKTSDKATFTFGRMNPPTTGHKMLVDTVKDHARRNGADHHVFVSQTQDKKKNPLTFKQKIDFVHKLMPNTNVHNETSVKTALDALKHLHGKGYKDVTMMVGGDRVQEFSNLVHKYNGAEGSYNFPNLQVKSAGDRDPDAEGVEGMSASKMRDHAVKKNFAEFSKGVPVKTVARDLYKTVRAGMQLENYQALFLTGGPGSGKDFVLRTALSESGAIEVNLNQLYFAIEEQEEVPNLDFSDSPPLIINGNGDSTAKVTMCKNVLEALGYKTGMIFVYTDNEDSQQRNEARIKKGEKTISESVRIQKYDQSIRNMHQFNEQFAEGFFLFNNSENFPQLSEDKQTEIVGWIKELRDSLNSYFHVEAVTVVDGPKSKKVKTKGKQMKDISDNQDTVTGGLGLTANFEEKRFDQLRKHRL